MKQIAQEQKYIVLIAPVGRGRNNRHSAGCDEGKAFPFILLGNNGIKESSKVLSWKYGSIEKRSTLNSINMMGYTKNETAIKASKDVWDEKLKVEYGDTGSDLGNYTIGDDKIRLSDKLLGGGREGSAKLAAVMSHEGTHAYGNRYEGIAHMAAADTYSQINTIFNLTGDGAFSNEMLKGIMNPESWKENEGDVDHWTIKMHADGSHEFINDNKKTLSIDYLDSDGNVISTSKIKDDRMNKMGWAESMVTALGSERAEEILGSSYLNADNYDYQTLKDVLKLDDEAIARIQHRGSLEGLNITESQKNSLLGEASSRKTVAHGILKQKNGIILIK